MNICIHIPVGFLIAIAVVEIFLISAIVVIAIQKYWRS
jgi:hypothetical protein